MKKKRLSKIRIYNILFFTCVLMFSVFLTACQSNEKIITSNNEAKKIKIITTNFPCYDFVRAITNDNKNVEIKMILKPGMDSHSYDPTPKDIIEIENSDIFVYVGGDSDTWVKKIIDTIENKEIKYLKMSDYVTMIP